jgi:predicted O-methyltransferase YrrM
MTYDLSHLTAPNQDVWGPIQDDEALLLYALCRVMCIKRVVEFGSLAGYSASNFLAAVGPSGAVYSVDDCRDAGLGGPLPKLAENHHLVIKAVADLTPEDVHEKRVDLVFFDCHTEDQLIAYNTLHEAGLLRVGHLLCFHDTGLHGPGTPFCKPEREVQNRHEETGWVHGNCERKMVNWFVQCGYHALHLEPSLKAIADAGLRVRHGLSILSKFKTLPTR